MAVVALAALVQRVVGVLAAADERDVCANLAKVDGDLAAASESEARLEVESRNVIQDAEGGAAELPAAARVRDVAPLEVVRDKGVELERAEPAAERLVEPPLCRGAGWQLKAKMLKALYFQKSSSS